MDGNKNKVTARVAYEALMKFSDAVGFPEGFPFPDFDQLYPKVTFHYNDATAPVGDAGVQQGESFCFPKFDRPGTQKADIYIFGEETDPEVVRDRRIFHECVHAFRFLSIAYVAEECNVWFKENDHDGALELVEGDTSDFEKTKETNILHVSPATPRVSMIVDTVVGDAPAQTPFQQRLKIVKPAPRLEFFPYQCGPDAKPDSGYLVEHLFFQGAYVLTSGDGVKEYASAQDVLKGNPKGLHAGGWNSIHSMADHGLSKVAKVVDASGNTVYLRGKSIVTRGSSGTPASQLAGGRRHAPMVWIKAAAA